MEMSEFAEKGRKLCGLFIGLGAEFFLKVRSFLLYAQEEISGNQLLF